MSLRSFLASAGCLTVSLMSQALPAVQAINVIQSNDDGWAEMNLRVLFRNLMDLGHNVVVSAPATDQSGTEYGRERSMVLAVEPSTNKYVIIPDSLDIEPFLPVFRGCEFGSCPKYSPRIGKNASEPRLNYVNSFPATSMRKGIQKLSRPYFDGNPPDLAITGPNVGRNDGARVIFSGTVGAAVAAVRQGVPALAFSGLGGQHTAWNADEVPLESTVYADLAMNVTDQIIRSGPPYIPPDVFLNVNFPAVNARSCADPTRFRFILTRINNEPFPVKDIQICDYGSRKGDGQLPTDSDVIEESSGTRGGGGGENCFASISVGDAKFKRTASAAVQVEVVQRLGGFLSCFPFAS